MRLRFGSLVRAGSNMVLALAILASMALPARADCAENPPGSGVLVCDADHAGTVDGTGYDEVVIEDGVTLDGNIDVATDTTVRVRGKVTSYGTFGSFAVLGEDRSSVDNEGAIEVTAGGTAIRLTGENIRVANHQGATISATGSGGAWGVVYYGSSGTLDNSGDITVAGDRAVGLSAYGNGHVVENTGLISATGLEVWALVLSAENSEVSNHGIINAMGTSSRAEFATGSEVCVNNASRGPFSPRVKVRTPCPLREQATGCPTRAASKREANRSSP